MGIVANIVKPTNNRYYVMDGVTYYSFTPCPFDHGLDYYLMPAMSARCSSYVIFRKTIYPKNSINDYIINTLGQLLMNNRPTLITDVAFKLKKLFMNWVLDWPGNHELQNEEYLSERVDSAIEFIKDEGPSWEDVVVQKQVVGQWYSLRVELIECPTERTKEKQRLRSDSFIEGAVQDIIETSEDYQSLNLGVKPTVFHISDISLLSKSTVRKYGKGYFIGKKENTIERLFAFKEMCPEATCEHISRKLGINKSTIYRIMKEDLKLEEKINN
jgi:hypothetical protein